MRKTTKLIAVLSAAAMMAVMDFTIDLFIIVLLSF